MRIVVAVVMIAVALLGPTAVLVVLILATGSVLGPGCHAGLSVGTVPGSLTATTADGAALRLDRVQLGHAATIVRVGGRIDGVGRDGVIVALMAALTESRLRMLANTTAYPSSGGYPNDGDGTDHDSLGLFQMRPAAGWGSVADLMDPDYQARAFFGGPHGPNGGSPRGLLDIPHWQALPKGAAAQAVEVSAYPDRYAAFEPVAEAILDALETRPISRSVDDAENADDARTGGTAAVFSPTSGELVFPLPAGTWRRTSGFGYRVHPVTGDHKLHAGVDYGAAFGTPVLAVADGTVSYAGPDPYAGNLVVIDHHIGGRTVASAYAHLAHGSTIVSAGDHVTAGQQIAAVGATGTATGPHLHLQIHPGGFDQPAVDPERAWLDGTAEVERAAPPACFADSAEASGS